MTNFIYFSLIKPILASPPDPLSKQEDWRVVFHHLFGEGEDF
jgi:hypothetical protein